MLQKKRLEIEAKSPDVEITLLPAPGVYLDKPEKKGGVDTSACKIFNICVTLNCSICKFCLSSIL